MRVELAYKKHIFPLHLEQEDRMSVVFDFIREVTPLSVETCRMIYKGKTLSLHAFAADVVVDGAKILLIGSTQAEVDFVRNARADPLVKGFHALERDEKLRRKRTRMLQKSFWGTKQDKEFKFCTTKAEFKYTTPTPYDADALLQKLATDPGIVKIMTERKFVVGTLTEMSPAEAQERMLREGKDGDLLGFNENFGGRIVLRIRTDDVKGFRPYYDLVNTLIHELTHNVFGPHDEKFWTLFRELKKDYDHFHDGWSRNGRTVGQSAVFAGFDDSEEETFAIPLGGESVDRATARKIAALRATERLAASAKLPKIAKSEPVATHGLRGGPPPLILWIPASDSTSDAPMPPTGTSAASVRLTHSEARTAAPSQPVESIPTKIHVGDGVAAIADDGAFLADGMDTGGIEWVHAFQSAARNLPPESLHTLRTLVQNLKLHPNNPKFRLVKRTARRIQSLTQAGGGRCMELLGFECQDDQYSMHTRRVDIGKFVMAYDILSP